MLRNRLPESFTALPVGGYLRSTPLASNRNHLCGMMMAGAWEPVGNIGFPDTGLGGSCRLDECLLSAARLTSFTSRNVKHARRNIP